MYVLQWRTALAIDTEECRWKQDPESEPAKCSTQMISEHLMGVALEFAGLISFIFIKVSHYWLSMVDLTLFFSNPPPNVLFVLL